MTGAVILILAWGAFAFGAVYPWAYTPLAIACALAGGYGLVAGRYARAEQHNPPEGGSHSRTHEHNPPEGGSHNRNGGARLAPVNRPIALGLALVALAIAIQLVPLPRATLVRMSPGTDAFLQKYDLMYAALVNTEALRAREAKGGAEAPPYGGPEGPPYKDAAATRSGGAEAPPSDHNGSHSTSIDPDQTRLALALLAGFGVFLLGVARGMTARDVRRFAPWIVGLGTAMALAGIVGKATYAGKIYGLWQPYAVGAQPFGPFVNRNHFAGWMVMALSLGLGYFCALVGRAMRGVKPRLHDRIVWLSSREASRTILAGVALLVMGLALVMTLSRSGIACLAIALAISGFVALRRLAKRSKRALLGGYCVLLFAVALGWTGLDAVVSRFQDLGIGYADRQAIWNDTLHVFRDFPVFGSGANTFGTAMLVYQTADPNVHFNEAHNDYLQLLSEGGALVVIPALVLLALVAREVRRRFRDDTDDSTTYWIRVGAVTGLVAIGLQEVVEFSLQMPGNAALFCVLTAIAAGRLPHRQRL